MVASKSHLNEQTKKFINDIKGNVELIQAGSSLKFIKIAEGLIDIYPRLAPTSEWIPQRPWQFLKEPEGRFIS